MQKIRYEIDPHNRLVVEKTGRKSALPTFRKVLDGSFKTDKHNSLSYHIKAPLADSEDTPHHSALRASGTGQVPHQIKIKGAWSLDDNHNLRCTINKAGRETFGDMLTLTGDIIDVDKQSLLFAVTTKTKKGIQSTYILKLKGTWRADKHNRLAFHAKKEKGRHDILTFRGAWEINKNHQIIYCYEKAHLIRKRKRIHALTFKGYWDIADKVRILYVIDKTAGSVFDFSTDRESSHDARASLGIFKNSYIKYELGIGLSGRQKPLRRTILLFGTWRIKKGVGLLFEVEYEDKKIHAIVFGAEAQLTARDVISFRLRNEAHQNIGVNLKLSHKILKGDGEAFFRILRSKRESAVYVGAGRRW